MSRCGTVCNDETTGVAVVQVRQINYTERFYAASAAQRGLNFTKDTN